MLNKHLANKRIRTSASSTYLVSKDCLKVQLLPFYKTVKDLYGSGRMMGLIATMAMVLPFIDMMQKIRPRLVGILFIPYVKTVKARFGSARSVEDWTNLTR